ncbi:hypothetical protein VP01_558g1 [Puccinia sorghi]|uniref:Uncharacterized protein n=1 Tax=Puccinia sorghi TaxID=27349 RepID=A0A0L6UJV0_9BASI|nr:hypothetical protein VP01_558g1 [Puccinia sorghi]
MFAPTGKFPLFDKLFLSRFPNSTTHLKDCQSVKTHLTPGVQLQSATEEDHQAFLAPDINYCSFTGMLNYLACQTQPDLASAVSILSRFNQHPGISHWKEFLHRWKYLKGTQHFALLLQPKADSLIDRINFYTDATWIEDHKRQKNITSSLTESELSALSDIKQEGQWLKYSVFFLALFD